jgi:flagellar assembly protein FliH
MNWSNTISFGRPLRNARLLTKSPPQDWNEFLRDREQAAFERGRQEGEHALSEQLLQQRNETVELQTGVIHSLRQAVSQVIQETETALIDIALAAAQKIVAGMPISVELVENVVREAVKQAEGSTEITVQLNPEDLALLRLHHSALINGLPETGPLRFTATAEVTRGGCFVQTRFGIIDARRETKMNQLRQTLSV